MTESRTEVLLTAEEKQRIRHADVFGHAPGPAIEGLLVLDDPDGNGRRHQLTAAGVNYAWVLRDNDRLRAGRTAPLRILLTAFVTVLGLVCLGALVGALAVSAAVSVSAVLYGTGAPIERGVLGAYIGAVMGGSLSMIVLLKVAVEYVSVLWGGLNNDGD